MVILPSRASSACLQHWHSICIARPFRATHGWHHLTQTLAITFRGCVSCNNMVRLAVDPSGVAVEVLPRICRTQAANSPCTSICSFAVFCGRGELAFMLPRCPCRVRRHEGIWNDSLRRFAHSWQPSFVPPSSRVCPNSRSVGGLPWVLFPGRPALQLEGWRSMRSASITFGFFKAKYRYASKYW